MSTHNLEVTLEPHRGVRMSRGLPLEVDLGQDVVFINGVWSGYVQRKPIAYVQLLHSNLPEDLVEAIKAQVDAIRAERGLPPTIALQQTTQLRDNNVVVEEPESLEDEEL